MIDSFNPTLVTASYVISVFGSYTALQLLNEAKKNPAGNKVWLAMAALALGGGAIWSMHFVGMLAYQLSIPVSYDIGLTLLSLVVAVAVTAVGFTLIIGRNRVGVGRLLLAGTIMGAGVVFMHYTGMAAMRVGAHVHHDSIVVARSTGIAIFASIAALWIAVNLHSRSQQIVAAFIMGLAVCGMHYTAMMGMEIVPNDTKVDYFSGAVLSHGLAPYVLVATAVILSLSLVAVMSRQVKPSSA